MYELIDGQAQLIGLPAVARARAENDASVSVAAVLRAGLQAELENNGA